jgi:hypothetical protein
MISRNSTAKLARPWNSEASSEADMVGTRRHQHPGHDDGHRDADSRRGLGLFRRLCHLGDGHAA